MSTRPLIPQSSTDVDSSGTDDDGALPAPTGAAAAAASQDVVFGLSPVQVSAGHSARACIVEAWKFDVIKNTAFRRV